MFYHSLVEVTAMVQDNCMLMDLSHNSDKLLRKREMKLLINSIRISSWKMESYKVTSISNSKHRISPCNDSISKCSSNNQCCPSTRLEWDQSMEITIITTITTRTTKTSFTLSTAIKKTYLLLWRAVLTEVHLQLHRLCQTLINHSKLCSNRIVISVMSMRMSKLASLRHSERNTEMRCSSMVQITMMTTITVVVKDTSLLMMMISTTTKMRSEFYSYVILIWTNSRSLWFIISSVTTGTSSR